MVTGVLLCVLGQICRMTRERVLDDIYFSVFKDVHGEHNYSHPMRGGLLRLFAYPFFQFFHTGYDPAFSGIEIYI